MSDSDRPQTPPVSAFPALTGGVVTEAHAKICAERGHATYRADGVGSGSCPRCGDVTVAAQSPTFRVETTRGTFTVAAPSERAAKIRTINEHSMSPGDLTILSVARCPLSDTH